MTLTVRRAVRPLTDRWRDIDIEPRGSTLLGVSFRPRQVEALGLDTRATLHKLLDLPLPLIRLGAYWSRMEPEPGAFDPEELDWQIDASEHSGKRIILCVGAVKTFGYPEFFVPEHHLPEPLREGALVRPATHPALLEAAVGFVSRVVDRYRGRNAILAWQVEHEAVDPLGMEHSWRLATSFVEKEIEAVRRADSTRPVLLNGYLPNSLLEQVPQWWRTRDQGDSLALAARLSDIVGIDHYPRHALLGVGPWSAYLDGSTGAWKRIAKMLRVGSRAHDQRLMITEGQAEPWERVTTPPSPPHAAMYSCPPEQVIANYNATMRGARAATLSLEAYFFWGAEYWVLRAATGDNSYLGTVARILEESKPK